MESEDGAVIEAAEQRLTQASHKLAEAMYKNAGSPSRVAPVATIKPGRRSGAGGNSEDVIDAEVVDAESKSN